MKKIRSSRLFKTVCLILCVGFIVGVAANAVLGLLLTNTNLWYAEESQLRQLAYDAAVDYYNDDVQKYLDITLRSEDAKYPQQEIQLYETKFGETKSNLAFTVRDSDGKVVLSNRPASGGYTFTRTLAISVDWFGPEAEDTTTPAETATAADTENETLPSSGDATVAADTGETATVPASPDTTAASQDATAAPETTAAPLPPEVYNGPEPNIYALDETDSDGQPYKFRYVYYGDEYNEIILNYCLDLYRAADGTAEQYAEHEREWLVFYEDDFAVSVNGEVYYTSNHRYVCGTAEQPMRYYEATYTLPEKLTAKDLFYYADKLAAFAYGYIRAFVPITVIFALAAAVFFILLLVCAGYVKNDDAPRARGLHRLPYDVVLALCLFSACALTVFILAEGNVSPAVIVLAAAAAAVILVLFVETTVVRCRAKTIAGNFLCVRAVKWAVRLIKKASENTGILLKLGIVFVVATAAEVVYSLLLCAEDEFIILLLVFKVIEIPLLLLLAVNLSKLQSGAKRLAEGKISEKIEPKYLFGEFRKNADYLNAIGDGVNAAVNERMRSERMKTELITNVSHDLKTPLTSIINYVELLKGTGITDPKAAEYVDVIDRQSQRLKKLCTDVVDASKAATGNLTMNMERTALGVMLGQVIGEYDARLKERSLTLVADLPDADVAVMADGRLLWRVFDNLMNNICKYSMEGTRVYLSLSADGGYARTVFRNISGAPLGAKPDELTERFVRGDSSRSTDGSGLGLSIAKSLTERMGGAFAVNVDGDLFKATVSFPIENAS